MKTKIPEFVFLVAVILLTIAGFWDIYFGVNAKPNAYHHLHAITNLIWLILLLSQLTLISKRSFGIHHKLGLSIFFMGPLLVATVALLSVHSASRAVATGQEDILIVGNVMVSLELGFIILMAFIIQRKSFKLHGAFLMSSALLFMGIALFFTLITFVPQYKIEGPETFYRFETAATASRYCCAAVGLFFFLKNMRNGWPWLLVSFIFFMNELINSLVVKADYTRPLTSFVGSFDETIVFTVTFVGLLILLILIWQLNKKKASMLNMNQLS